MPPRRRARPGASSSPTALVRELAALLDELGLSEIEVRWGGAQVRLQRSAPAAAGGAAPAPALSVADARATPMITVEAPMVGTFYAAPSPTAEPYVREDGVVKEGQILCIIEAMKLMNEIESRASGRVAKVLVENGQPVEYGQPLFLIDPLG